MSDDESLIRIPTDVKVKEEILGDPAPKVITDFILPEKKGPLGYLPIIVWGIVLLIGVINFIVFNAVNTALVQSDTSDFDSGLLSWIFYCGMLILTPYLLRFIKNKMNFSIEQLHRITDISREAHLKLKKRIFGPIGMVVVILLTVIFIIWDITGFGVKYSFPMVILPAGTTSSLEGFLNDMASVKTSVGDQVFYLMTSSGAISFQAVLFVIVWEAYWLFQSQLLWYVIGYLWYLWPVQRKYEYREPVEMVIKLGLTKPVHHSIVEVGWGFIPFLVLKFIYQIMNPFDIWPDDTTSTILILAFFLILTIVPSMLITSDLKREHAEAMHHAEVLGADALENVVQKAETTGVPIAEAVTALLLNTYLQEMKAKQGGAAGGMGKKMATSCASPIASYGAKEGLALSGTNLSL
jgi:hypothetical protein